MSRSTGIDATVVAAACTLPLALLPWSALGTSTQLVVVTLAVVVLGLPHGAYDAWLVVDRAGGARRRVVRFVAYLAAVVGVFVAWPWAPNVALGAFLVLSIVHFGRGDHGAAGFGFPAGVEVPIRGGWVVLGPLAGGGPELQFVFASVVGEAGSSWIAGLEALRVPLAVLWFVLGLIAFARRRRRAIALEVIALGTLVLAAPPLIAFAVYFCGWHSVRHLLNIRATGRSWSHIARRSLPAVVGTLILAAIAAGMDDGTSAATLARVLFVGLAAVSVPHVVLVDLARVDRRDGASIAR